MIAKSSALLGRAPGLPSAAGPWGWPGGNFQLGFWRPKRCLWGPFRMRTGRCWHQNRPRRPRKNVGLTQNPQPFWENAIAAALQKDRGQNRKILSPFGTCPTAAQPGWVLGPARRKFSIWVLAPKKVPMGSVSDAYRPMPAPEAAEETPEKCRPDAKSSALLGNPLPPLHWQRGAGPWGRAQAPRLPI